MSWGALNNQRERKSADPLPDFLTDLNVKNFTDRGGAQSAGIEDVITHRSERLYDHRAKAPRGYGVSYAGTIDIRISKKTLFISMLFFAAIVLMAFCVGYTMRGVSSDIASQANNIELMSTKKPIVPTRKKEVRAQVIIEKTLPAEPLAVPTENIDTVEESTNLKTSADSKNNNKDNNGSEAVYEEADPSTEDNDVVD